MQTTENFVDVPLLIYARKKSFFIVNNLFHKKAENVNKKSKSLQNKHYNATYQ